MQIWQELPELYWYFEAPRPKPEAPKVVPPPARRKVVIRTIRGGSVEQMIEFTAAATKPSDGG